MEIKATSFSVDPNSTIKSLSIYFELYYLHGEEAPVSITGRMQTDIRISQPTWLKACAPYLEIGDFLLLELRLPENLQVKEFWYTLYSAAANNVHEMERYIRNGDWENTLREARRFFENIKIGDSKTGNTEFKQEFNKLMAAAGHTPEGIGNLHDAIWQLFEFTSKYVHEKDKNGNLKPIIVTSKEDAYFAMSVCVGLLNLIGRKISM